MAKETSMSEALAKKDLDSALEAPQGSREILVDDDHTRVTRWVFEPGEGTGWHRHELPYLVVPQSTGSLTLRREHGAETVVTYEPGGATKWSDVPFVHHAVNTSGERVQLLEIEYKRAAG